MIVASSKKIKDDKKESDKEVVNRILQNDKPAFAELIARYKDKGFSLAIKMLKNREDAEEALQDAFIRAFKALHNFQWNSSFSTWFYRIVFNVCYSRLNSESEKFSLKGSSISNMEEDRIDELGQDTTTPDKIYVQQEIQTVVKQEIDNLPSHYSIVLNLFLLQEQSYEEIVSITGVNMGTIKAQISRARSLLRVRVGKRLGISY